jgi:alpha(1,3/1,4) fucosyltransferase
VIQACIVVSPPYQSNQIFDLSSPILNRDDCLHVFYLLRQEFAKIGINLSTSDVVNPDDCNIVIYNDMPKKMPNRLDKNKSYLLLFESELIRPDNWDLEKHEYFNKIFTWNDEFVDNVKYFKINFSSEFPVSIQKNIVSKKKLCTLIAGNKVVSHPLELYSKRIEAIRWFERNRPMDFDLYGIGWGEYSFTGPRIFRALNKIKPLTKLLAPKFPSYQGVVNEKKPTLEKYKFCICYENARDIPGYITEKIFDCFIAGCVPIYWGACNVRQHIPGDCFIDKREFDNYKEVCCFIKNINKNEYLYYLENIEKFLKSKSIKQFTIQHFTETIVSNVDAQTKQ